MSASNKKSSAAKSRDPLQKPWQRQTKAKAAVSQSATVGVNSPKVAAKETAKAPRQEEAKVYGENACRELFRQRPESIIRLYINSELAPRFADLMKYLAQQKRAYHLVDDTELEKVAGSQLRIEFNLHADSPGHGMTGSGMLVINPPYTLAQSLAPALSEVQQQLGNPASHYQIMQLVGE